MEDPDQMYQYVLGIYEENSIPEEKVLEID